MIFPCKSTNDIIWPPHHITVCWCNWCWLQEAVARTGDRLLVISLTSQFLKRTEVTAATAQDRPATILWCYDGFIVTENDALLHERVLYCIRLIQTDVSIKSSMIQMGRKNLNIGGFKVDNCQQKYPFYFENNSMLQRTDIEPGANVG